MEPILYCNKCFQHFGFMKSGNAVTGPHALCGGEIKAHKPVYAGIFFDEENHKKLLERFPPDHKNVFAHHLTLAYGRHMNEFYPLGRKVTVEVVNEIADGRGQCAIVRPDFLKEWLWEKQEPHITISCAEGVKPAYSNEMMAEFKRVFVEEDIPGVEKISVKLTGTLDYFPRLTT